MAYIGPLEDGGRLACLREDRYDITATAAAPCLVLYSVTCLLALGAGSTYAAEDRAAVAYVNTSAMASSCFRMTWNIEDRCRNSAGVRLMYILAMPPALVAVSLKLSSLCTY